MRALLFAFLLVPTLAWVQVPNWQAQNEEEALFLRRIAEFWQEGDYAIAKSQMEEYIAEYPDSPFSNPLCAALGDLCLREKNYPSALQFYSRIREGEFFDRVFLNRMQCLYQLQWHATLADECEARLKKGIEGPQKLHTAYYLAIALYQQCLHAKQEPEVERKLARRAEPYFELLFQSELSNEVALGFAHLCSLLNNYEKAAGVYLELAKRDPSQEEEMLFQAALTQSLYNKKLAMNTFDEIAKKGRERGREAAYNRLVLAFDEGLYEELTLAKREIVAAVPTEKVGMAHLFLGRSFFALKNYEGALSELMVYTSEETTPSDHLYGALLNLLEASYQANRVEGLNLAIEKLRALYPSDPELARGLFSRAQLMKKNQQRAEARVELTELLAQFPAFEQRSQAAFELAHLDYQNGAWEACRLAAIDFLTQFPNHDLAPFAWRYFASSSAKMALEDPKYKEQLALDLEAFLKQPNIFSEAEFKEWSFLLAKTDYELGSYERSISLLQENDPNAQLLLALCLRDGRHDLKAFCEKAEEAIGKGATLMSPAQIQTSLFNAYLDLSQSEPIYLDKAAERLFATFKIRGDLKEENLTWLAETFYEKRDPRAQVLLEKLTAKGPTSDTESAFCKLAKLYERPEDRIILLEELMAQYESSASARWAHEKEARLLLGEGYLQLGRKEEALELFDAVVAASSSVRNFVSASASLQSARLKKERKENLVQVATQLKDLVIQRNWLNEPIHLEAALDYIDLQDSKEKRLTLLKKTKEDFTGQEDLIGKDYQAAREKNPQKEALYQGYLKCIDAQILMYQAQSEIAPEQQKELQAKAKALFLQIVDEQVDEGLLARVRNFLKPLEAASSECSKA